MKVAATFLNSLIIERPFCEKVGTFGQHFFFFSIYTIYTFSNKNLQPPSTYISKRTWDSSQKAITK